MTRHFFFQILVLAVALSFFGAGFPRQQQQLVYAQAQYSVLLKLMRQRQYREAFAVCQQLIESAPQPAKVYQRLAELANEAELVTEAATFLQRLPDGTPDQRALKHYGLAALYALKDVSSKAERQLVAEHSQLALSFNLGMTKSYQLLADAWIALGEEAKLEQYLKERLAQAPQNALTQVWLGYFHKRRGRLEASLAAVDKALELDPNALEAIYEKTNILVRIKGEKEPAATQAALTLGQELLWRSKRQGNLELQIKAQRIIGYAHEGLKDHLQAIQSYRAGLELAAEAGELAFQEALLTNLCANYIELDDYANALGACRQGGQSRFRGSKNGI